VRPGREERCLGGDGTRRRRERARVEKGEV